MKKTFALSLILLLLLTACSKQSTNDSPIEINPNSVVLGTNENLADEVPVIDTSSRNIRLITEFEGYNDWTASPTGVYSVENILSDTANVMYTDFETKQKVFLCTRPECTHDNETCTSWVNDVYEMPGVVFAGGKVVLIHSALKSSEGNNFIATTDPNGSNYTELYRFAPNESVFGSIATDDAKLYFTMWSTTEDDVVVDLVSLSLGDGKLEKIQRLTYMDFLMGGYGPYVIIKNISETNGDVLADANEEALSAAFEGQKHTIYMLNTENTEQTIPLMEYMQMDSVAAVYDSKLVFLNIEAQELEYIDFTDMQKHSVSFSIPGLATDNIILDGFFDNKLFIQKIDGMIDEATLLVNRYIISLETGVVEAVDLRNSFNNRPLSVLAQYDNSFFVMVDIHEETVTRQYIDGSFYEEPMLTALYALISKTDYYAGNGNYDFIGTPKF